MPVPHRSTEPGWPRHSREHPTRWLISTQVGARDDRPHRRRGEHAHCRLDGQQSERYDRGRHDGADDTPGRLRASRDGGGCSVDARSPGSGLGVWSPGKPRKGSTLPSASYLPSCPRKRGSRGATCATSAASNLASSRTKEREREPRLRHLCSNRFLRHVSSLCVRRAKLSRARAGVRRSVELSGVARKRTTLFAPRYAKRLKLASD